MPDSASQNARRRIVGGERSDWTADYLRRYRAGDSIRTIAGDTERSYGFVHQLLIEGGAELRTHGGARRGAGRGRLFDGARPTS